jgi:hypothetical protein
MNGNLMFQLVDHHTRISYLYALYTCKIIFYLDHDYSKYFYLYVSSSSLYPALPSKRGTRWRSWVRHCATSRKVAGTIPDGVIGTFH